MPTDPMSETDPNPYRRTYADLFNPYTLQIGMWVKYARKAWDEGFAAAEERGRAEVEKRDRALTSIHRFVRDHLDPDPAPEWGDYYTDSTIGEIVNRLQVQDDLDNGPIPSVRAIIERDAAAALREQGDTTGE